MACGATTRTKVALGILQLCFNYFAEPFSRHLVYTFPGRPKEKDSPVVSAFPPVPHGAYGHDQPVCQSFCAFPENQATLHTRVSHLTPSMVKALSILGRMLSQSAPFGVLTARKVSSAVMLFSSHKCTSSVCGGARVTTLRGLWNALSQPVNPHCWVVQGVVWQLQPQCAHPFSLWDPFINTTCQRRAYKYLQPRLFKLHWLNARIKELPFNVQLCSVRATTLSRSDANNFKGVTFRFLDQFVLYSCE